MFDRKKESLFVASSTKTTTTKPITQKGVVTTPIQPAFVQAGLANAAKSTEGGNGSLRYGTTGNDFVDQFGKLGTYRAPRDYKDIVKDAELLWSQNQLVSVMFMFYLRIITRKVKFFNGEVTQAPQKGGELKFEPIMRYIWLSQKSPETFWKNIGIFVSVGSWKDVIVMLQFDLMYNGWEGRVLNWDKFGDLILSALKNPNTSELLKKYLPAIKSNKVCKTVDSQADNMIGKWICSLLYGTKTDVTNPEKSNSGATYKAYRKLKSAGTAHQWQQLISQRKFDEIQFDRIHGRALKLLVQGKFLANQNLVEKYEAWVTDPKTKEIKFTGFVHELFEKAGRSSHMTVGQEATINKQFDTLVAKAKEEETKACGLIVVRDTSGSMCSQGVGTNMSSYDIAKALALYFSAFLEGKFADAWIEFNNTATMHTWKGSTPLAKWYNDHSSFFGGTNVLAVIDLLVGLKRQGVPESEFPTGILCISDGCFNPSRDLGKSNVESMRKILFSGGFSAKYCKDFIIALWDIPNGYGGNSGSKFETFGDVDNVFYMSGYSAAIVSFLGGEIKNANDLFNEAMNQETLQLIEL